MSVDMYSPKSARLLCWISKALCTLPIAIVFWGVESSQGWAVEVSTNQQVVPPAQKTGDSAQVQKPRITPTIASAPTLNKTRLAHAYSASDLLPIGRISVIPSEGSIAQTTALAESAPVKNGGSLDKSVTPETPGAPQPAKVSPIRDRKSVV